MEKGNKYIMNTYSRFPLMIVKGEGTYVFDDNGKKYLDFAAGIAVNSLGHGNKKLTDAIKAQCESLIHISNLYWNVPQVDLAEKLIHNSSFAKVFFCNSGAEAVEASLKLSRKFSSKNGSGKYEIIAMENSFHGRTFGAITATGQCKYKEGIAPLLPGICHCVYNDFESLKSRYTEKTCAVLLEPVQGESGIHPANGDYLKKVREFCDEKGLLLIFDEVQCGAGRCGELFAHEVYGVYPDIAVMAKGLAGGVPIGVMLANGKCAEGFSPGSHASTFGGNPLAAAAANVVMDELLGGLLENVKAQGEYLTQKLKALAEEHNEIIEVRGMGLMQGIELDKPVKEIISKCIDKGLLLVSAGENVIRFVPPLTVSKSETDECISVLESAFA